MIKQLGLGNKETGWLPVTVVILLVVMGAALLGLLASPLMLLLLGGVFGLVIMILWPFMGLIFMVVAALLLPIEIGTGTEVPLNIVVIMIPIVLAAWILYLLVKRDSVIVGSKSFLPLLLFLVSGLIALAVGNVLWDPLVPKSSNFFIVQMAQWAIFGLSAIAYFLGANLIDNEKNLRYLVFGFLLVAGLLSIASIFVGAYTLVGSVTTIAIVRTPFWILLAGIAGGQLLFNQRLSGPWRLFIIISLVAVILYAFIQQREAVSNWVGIIIVAAVLVWLRLPKLRAPIVVFTALLILTGILTQTLWEFGGGDSEWTTSGGSRLALITRVIAVTSTNPVTGLGPAAYRNYAAVAPLAYGKAFWVDPAINSHNNYVDVYSQTGLVGLGLFLWFMITIVIMGWRLARRYQSGFVAGYVNGMIAAWFAITAVMMLLDWFLPFVYNVGFPGFQASVMVWMFFGGLVAVDNFP